MDGGVRTHGGASLCSPSLSPSSPSHRNSSFSWLVGAAGAERPNPVRTASHANTCARAHSTVSALSCFETWVWSDIGC